MFKNVKLSVGYNKTKYKKVKFALYLGRYKNMCEREVKEKLRVTYSELVTCIIGLFAFTSFRYFFLDVRDYVWFPARLEDLVH